MSQNRDAALQTPALYSEAWFEALFDAVDRLHDAVCRGELAGPDAIAPAVAVGWLDDIIYTAGETISEIRASDLLPGQRLSTSVKTVSAEKARKTVSRTSERDCKGHAAPSNAGVSLASVT